MTNLVESNNNNNDDYDYDAEVINAEVIDSRSVTNQSQDKRTVVGEDDGDLQDHGTQESFEIYDWFLVMIFRAWISVSVCLLKIAPNFLYIVGWLFKVKNDSSSITISKNNLI